MTAQAQTKRLDYLDAVRAFALLLGIVFHASMSFIPIFVGWAVMDVSTSQTVTHFIMVSHSFRMELFFLIAGFFSHMTFHRNGVARFARLRFLRIVVPFVVGWFILRPLLQAGWVMGGQSLRGDVDVIAGLKAGFQSLSELPTGLFIQTHLWFLYYLVLVTTIVLILRAAATLSQSLAQGFYTLADRIVHWTANSPCSSLVLAIPTAACLWHMSIWGMETPDRSLSPHWPVLLIYSGFFGFGWLLHRQDDLIERFGEQGIGRFGLCTLSAGVTIYLSRFQADPGHPQIVWIRTAFVLGYSIMMWSLVSLSIGLFRRFCNRPNKIIRYLADSSYWLYLIHLPIVIWLQIAVAELPVHWSVKLIGVSLFTIVISIALYDLMVRSTVIGKILNGKRQRREIVRRRPENSAGPTHLCPQQTD